MRTRRCRCWNDVRRWEARVANVTRRRRSIKSSVVVVVRGDDSWGSEGIEGANTKNMGSFLLQL